MSLSFDPQPFDFVYGPITWLAVVLASTLVIGIAFLVISVLTSGLTGLLRPFTEVGAGFADLAGTSMRRLWALTMLSFREALRRKVLLVLFVFAVLFMFAGWFLSDVTLDAEMQVKNYVSFVLRVISWLILPIVLLLACWSLPDDIKARSLHTVVTKPARKHEIVLGRIGGICLIGGGVLALMGVVGYIWITRQLPDRMQSYLIGRVPIYGQISFLDREGGSAAAGVNTGDENPFRSFVEGNTSARAIWDFSNLDPSRFSDEGLVLESTFQAFRTYKGNIERGLMCQYALVNPEKKLKVLLAPFEVQEFRRNVYRVKAENPELQDADGKTVDLYKDVISNGKLRVEVACLNGGQFLGMARPDLFVRLPDRPFWITYSKSIISTGLMMVMIVVLGVVSSCFLKGPVATVLTVFMLLVGRLAHGFMQQLTSGKLQGAGLADSLYRIPTHITPTVELDPSLTARFIAAFDRIELSGLWAVQHLFPDFRTFDTIEYVANGFDVPWAEAMLPSIAVTLGYCVPWIVVGYFSLKLRELEAK
jgi:hypothetical protein